MTGWKVSEIVGSISATAFALTVVYLYGYDVASRHDLFEFFSVNDYFRLAIEWLIPVAGCWLIGVLIEIALRRLEHGATEQEIQERFAKGPHPKFWRAFRKVGLEGVYYIAVLAVAVNTGLLLFTRLPRLQYCETMTVVGPLAWFAAVKWYEREKRLTVYWSNACRIWIWLFPAVLIFAFFKGGSTAERAKVPFMNAKVVQVYLVGEHDPVAGRVLFNLENYLLLRADKDGGLEAIPERQVSRIVEGTSR